MNVQDAFYNTVHEAPGGVEALAGRMAMSAAVLRNKANPNATSNTPSLGEADRIMGITGDHRILHSLAANHGYVCVGMPSDVVVADLAVLEIATHIWTTNGEVGKQLHQALADGRVTKDEVERVRDAVRQTERALEEMLARLSQMAEK